jgi:ribosomal protein L11 methyltransferase
LAPETDDPTLVWHVEVSDAFARERVMGAAWEDGASGVEERSDRELVIYAPSSVASSLGESLARAVADEGVVAEAEPVADIDWTEQWKVGQGPIVISPRLVVRPSFAAHALGAGQCEIVIDPGQAFGTGGHASTRLVLEWVDVLCGDGEAHPPQRVLDVGTGSGVLALAATALGSEFGIGFDLDPLAAIEARRWTDENGLEDRVAFFTGPIEAVAATAVFDLVLANLLKRELLPIAAEAARTLASNGRLILSGLLEADAPEVTDALAAHGLVETGRRHMRDANGDLWIAPCFEHRDEGRV